MNDTVDGASLSTNRMSPELLSNIHSIRVKHYLERGNGDFVLLRGTNRNESVHRRY